MLSSIDRRLVCGNDAATVAEAQGEEQRYKYAQQGSTCTLNTPTPLLFQRTLQVDMAAEQEHFYQVTSTALTILAQDLEAACDAALLAMTKIKYVLLIS